MKLIISLSIFIFCIHISLAQGFRVSSYNREDGLQSELDKSISQDALGFIWVASDEGLIRFNGFKFQLFRNELISPYCKDLVCLPDGRLYSSSDKGIMELHCSPDNVRFEVIAQTEIDSKDTLMWFPKQFSVDKKNNVWCGDQTSVYKIIGKKVERYKFPYTSYSYDWQHAASVVDDALYGILTISQTGKIFSVDTVTKLLNPWIINTQIPKVQSCLGLSPGKILVCADGKIRVLSLKKNYTATDSIIADLDASELHRTASGRIYIGKSRNTHSIQ
jgi:hypothetical protein